MSGHYTAALSNGRVVFSHECVEGEALEVLPRGKWKAMPDGSIRPSVACMVCGFHEFIHITNEEAE